MILLKCANVLLKSQVRQFCGIFTQSLEIPTFSNIYINIPFNVVIKPLDVHLYHNCDKLLVKLHCSHAKHSCVKCEKDGNNVSIVSTKGAPIPCSEALCSISAPIKSNLEIISEGDISIGSFNGDKISAFTKDGNIFLDKYEGNQLRCETYNGDITLNKAVKASNINLLTKNGVITTDKMQSLSVDLKTEKGDIAVKSSYCNDSSFETEKGNLVLQNIHKNCKVCVKDKGNVNITGLDGKLDLNLQSGDADIQVSRITEDSNININKSGNLNLRLDSNCQENTRLEVLSKQCVVDNEVTLAKSKIEDILYLTPMLENSHLLKVHCNNSSVSISTASWADFFKSTASK